MKITKTAQVFNVDQLWPGRAISIKPAGSPGYDALIVSASELVLKVARVILGEVEQQSITIDQWERAAIQIMPLRLDLEVKQ